MHLTNSKQVEHGVSGIEVLRVPKLGKLASVQFWVLLRSVAYSADVQLFGNDLRQLTLFQDEYVLHKSCELHGGLCWRNGHSILADSRPLSL